MNSNNVDLTNCDREPIHIPGRIQSHGFLLAVDNQTLTITHVSENINDFISAGAGDILGLSVDKFGEIAAITGNGGQLSQLLSLGKTHRSFDMVNPYPVHINNIDYYLIISASGPSFLLEFEPATIEYDLQNQIGKSVSGILSGKNLRSLLHHTAREIKDIIHYDRVMVYRFLDDGHGEVIAEFKNEDLEPFYGLHYPASDIPKQARELYKLNYTRIIADVNTLSASIVTRQEDNAAVDLTHSVLRAVSPVHIQYLKNMGVASSFSISLMAHGELWGLVACHNYQPKYIDYKAREAAKLIGQIVSSALEYREDEEHDQQLSQFQQAMGVLELHLLKDESLVSSLTKQQFSVQQIVDATGVAVLLENEMTTLGQTPDQIQLRELFDWLKATMEDTVYYTHRLPEVFHPAKAYKGIGSGIIAAMISKNMDEMIVWFKPEQIATINWAGNPDKPAVISENGLLNLSPRNSFELFSELIENTAVKWTRAEIANVFKIREKVLDSIAKKAGEIRILNERLKLAYEELDTFSYTISHDLRTPLTSIKSFTELVIATNKSLDEQGKKMLSRVVAGADKMNFLINEILKLARIGKIDTEYVSIDMTKLIPECAAEVTSGQHAHVQITFGELPAIKGTPALIGQVFTNLISNAVKYSASVAQPLVHVAGEVHEDEVIYKVQDNGIGIAMGHQHKVFELFKRMENVKDIEGTGVGLAIVKRIVEKHGARIWFESELKVGTVFYIALKK